MSRRGAHLWILAEQPLLARECRKWVLSVATELGIPVKGNSAADGLEIFPKHDELKPGEFGNAVRGPLGVHRAIQSNILTMLNGKGPPWNRIQN